MGFGKQNTGVILRHSSEGVSLGTLSNSTALKIDTPGGDDLTEDFRLLKMLLNGVVENMAAADCVQIGICSNELTVAEIAEALQCGGPKDRNDRLNEERATRPVWILATYYGDGSGMGSVINNGLPIESKPRWSFSAPEGFTLFAYNPLDHALTTGADFSYTATSYGVWLS